MLNAVDARIDKVSMVWATNCSNTYISFISSIVQAQLWRRLAKVQWYLHNTTCIIMRSYTTNISSSISWRKSHQWITSFADYLQLHKCRASVATPPQQERKVPQVTSTLLTLTTMEELIAGDIHSALCFITLVLHPTPTCTFSTNTGPILLI